MKKRKFRLKRRQPGRSRGGDLGVYIILTLFGVMFAIPLVMAICQAFKPLDELYKFPQTILVYNPTLNNFKDLFVIMGQSWVPFSRYIFNTVFITAIGTAGRLLIASMGAYVLAKYDFPGGRKLFAMITTAIMFNGYVTDIPRYLVISGFGWIDTFLAPIVPALAAPMGLFLMKQFMEGIPDSLLEAAKIDGAKEWGIFTKIVMPNVKPAWLTLIIFAVQELWNNPQSTYIYSEELKTLPYALSQITAGGVARAGAGAAVGLFMMIVPIGIFIFSESNILETMASSGIKE
ncbi:MAG: carbohydrate ABC transporter permease [Lachnospiraceae bacterium]|nr:carbohydrate ABC transporter permease [Lachnospiraceae bacterium]